LFALFAQMLIFHLTVAPRRIGDVRIGSLPRNALVIMNTLLSNVEQGRVGIACSQ